MVNTPPSVQSKRFGILAWFFFLPGLALGVLIFFLEYTYSNKPGNLLLSMFHAILVAILLAGGLMQLFVGIIEIRRNHTPWYQQVSILSGLISLSIFMTYSVILINTSMKNGLPDVAVVSIVAVGALIDLFACVRLLIALPSRNRAK